MSDSNSIERIREFIQEIRKARGPGQLCPYCEDNLSLPEEGWYRCPSCRQPFFAEDCDSDYEDYHCRKPSDRYPLPTTTIQDATIAIGT